MEETKYEYKSILIAADERIVERHTSILNDYFVDGWIYVDSIVQNPATGINGLYHSNVIIILKRNILSI